MISAAAALYIILWSFSSQEASDSDLNTVAEYKYINLNSYKYYLCVAIWSYASDGEPLALTLDVTLKMFYFNPDMDPEMRLLQNVPL